jgi:serine/threonine protein kinase
LEHYNTATNDLWSLGVILVNLTCGRNPWRQAAPSDETFRAFVHNPDFLRTILPISHATNHILKGLFALEPRDRMSLRELRKRIQAVDTFTMTEDELRTAHSAARAAAAAVRPIPPPAKVAPVPVPVHTAEEDTEMADMANYYADASNGHANVHPADRHRWSRSDSSAFGIDESIIDQIDFNHPGQAHVINPAPVAVVPQAISAPPAPIPIHVQNFDEEPYPLLPTSSRSSSSADVSLPPTPEFNPADKANAPPTTWNGGKPVARTDLLHVNIKSSLSPIDGTFSLV